MLWLGRSVKSRAGACLIAGTSGQADELHTWRTDWNLKSAPSLFGGKARTLPLHSFGCEILCLFPCCWSLL